MPISPTRRLAVSVGLAATLTLGLAACSASPETDPVGEGPDPTAVDVCATPTGDQVASIAVSGATGNSPDVEFDPGVSVTVTQRLVEHLGTGAEVDDGSIVSVAYSIYSGSSSELLEASGYDKEGPTPLKASADSLMPGLLKSIACVPIGSRVVSVIAPDDAFGDEGVDNENFTIDGGESLVAVIDIVRLLDRAWGTDQPATAGFPSVTLDGEGAPTVTVPEGSAPAELEIAVLKKGDGPVVPEHARVLVHYLGVSWDTKEMFDSSWSGGSPATFSLDEVVPGFAMAIAGQTVGSQVVAVIPPALAYGTDTGAADAHALAGQTLVFVIDILFALDAAGQ